MRITLKNYRCFSDERPACVEVRPGFTALLGVNNSGKSSLLKFFYEFRELFLQLSQPSAFVAGVRRNQGFQLRVSYEVEEAFNNGNSRGIQLEFDQLGVDGGQYGRPLSVTVTIPRANNSWSATVEVDGISGPISGADASIDGTTLQFHGNPVSDLVGLFPAFAHLANTLYIGPFRNAINVGTREPYFDLQIGQAFIARWRQMKTGNVRRENEAIYKLTQEVKQIFRLRSLEIDASATEDTLHLMVNGRSFKLPDVGSGLTQFIVVLASAAMAKPAYILIDEPELNLHPALQLDFLTTLAAYSGQGIIFSTQSIGLARSAAERIYAFQQIEEGKSLVTEFERVPRLSEFLGELSFSGFAELAFEKVLLVEGRTDVKTIQQFLRHYGKDHHVVLLSLGGSNMIGGHSEDELWELKRITNAVSAVIDSERAEEGAELDAERAGFVETCTRVGIDCHVLKLRAIENYLSDAAVKRIRGDECRALRPFEKLSELPLGWSKAENWRIAREMTIDELRETDLGNFLNSL